MESIEFNDDDVIGFDALFDSVFRTKKGVLWKDSVAAFYHRAIERTGRLCDELHNDTYRASPPRHFKVTSPKPRDIASISYRDRVYQRSLNDNVVYPEMTSHFIYDNWACQTGKGTDPARERLKEFMRSYYRHYGDDGWVAQIDIHGYYPNMDHDLIEKLFEKYLLNDIHNRVVRILREQYDGDAGYNPGSQLVQIAGISMLNDLDHYIKEQLHIHYYIRYMDDLILIHNSREYLDFCMKEIEKKLHEIHFEFNPSKTKVYSLSEGIPFLGFTFKLTETGKVLMIVDPNKIKTARKKYRRLVANALENNISKENVDQSFNTWINHISKGNSWKLIQRMKKYYKDLWKGDVTTDDP